MKRSSRLSPIMISFICRFLEASDSHLAFFEDVVTRLRDPVLSRSKSPYAVLGDDVFPYLPGGHHADSTVANLLKDVWAWRLVGVLTRHAWQLKGDWLLENRIVALVEHSQHLVVGASDGEGMIIVDWQ